MTRFTLDKLRPGLQEQVVAALHGPKAASRPPQPAKAPVYPFTLWGTLPPPLQEFRFAAPRRWRFDYAWLSAKVALEVEGGIWTGGRHTRGKGFLGDMEKYNTATVMGWRVLRVTPDQLKRGEHLPLLAKCLSC